MRTFLLTLRKVLLCDIIYYILLVFSIIYVIIYLNNYIPHKNIEKELIVTSYYIDGDRLSLELKNNNKYIGNYIFETEELKNNFNLNIGDKIRINGEYNIPNNNTIPNTFNYKKYLLSKRINYIIKINNYEVISNNKNILYKFKNHIIKRIESINNNEYLYAFILGTSKYFDEEVYENYRINTVTHLFALSGLHVSIFSMIVVFLLKRFKLRQLNILIITTIILFILCFVSSYTPSILRATIFYVLSSLNNIYYTYVKSKYLLFITFIILVLINPFYIFNLGFILSFTITFFILYSNEHYKIKNNLFSILFISIVSFFASVPILVNNFYTINIIGFLNNLFFIPLVSYVVYPLSLLTVIIKPFNAIFYIFTSVMEKVSLFSSKVLNLSIILSKMSVFTIIVYYILLLLIIKYKSKILIILLIVLLCTYSINLKKETCIYFLDVGQGDSILIKTDNNKSIMIDTGGVKNYYIDSWKEKRKTFDLVTSSIIPFLNSISIKSLDYLFITHGDADHIGNALSLKNNIIIKNIYINKGDINYLENNLSHNILIDNYMYIDNIKIESLNNIIYNNENDNSLVLLLTIYNYRILLMGDASIKVEKDILNKYDLSNIFILKLGHHGSNTSSSDELLNVTNPKYSIISVKLNNKYNHPSIDIINKLLNNNYTFYETSKYGTINFCFNKKSIKLLTNIP